ncbi:MAG: DUF1353 domain-containing protein [Pseudomonadota bacterium]
MPDTQTASHVSPYPEGSTGVRSLTYRDDLTLLRFKDAARTRTGEDAKFVLGADYRVTWINGDDIPQDIVVPRGLLTDLTSVPPLFRGLVGRVGPWLEAAVVHDYLTIAWRILDGQGTVERRRFADDIMWAAMTAAKVGFLRKALIYSALRVYAWIYFPRVTAREPRASFFVDLE